MSGITELPTPETPREFAIYLGMLQGTVGQISAQMQQVSSALTDVATKADIRELEQRIEAKVSAYVTRDEAERMIAEAARDAVPSFTRKLLGWVTAVGGACGVLAAGWLVLRDLVHMADKLPK